jgi:uncharacterized protein YdeI (YjbR/CyaY-like superfamily)
MKDKRIDAYIAKSAPFAQPILQHIRELVHAACPDVEEKMKWSFPHFDYQGQMMCSMAAFKEHTAMSFWKAPLIEDPKNLLDRQGSMGHFGRMTSLKDLPSDKVLIGFIKQAMKLNEAGVTVERKPAPKEITLDPPDYFMKALRKNKAALKTYEAFSPSNKREYLVWVTEAKTDDTRDKRLTTAVEWMAEGKIRNWKYVKK